MRRFPPTPTVQMTRPQLRTYQRVFALAERLAALLKPLPLSVERKIIDALNAKITPTRIVVKPSRAERSSGTRNHNPR